MGNRSKKAITMLLAVIMSAAFVVSSCGGKEEKKETTVTTTETAAPTSTPTPTPTPTSTPTPTPTPIPTPMPDFIDNEHVHNFLLIGIDSRSTEYATNSGAGDRSDIIMIMSVDDENNTIKLMSVARDSYAIIPGKGNNKGTKINAAMSSGSSKRSATQLNGSLTWRDMESDASITATLASRTVSPFAYNTPSSLNGAVRLDLLTQESRSGLMQSWLTRAAGVLGQLLLSGGGLNLSTVQPR